MTSHGRTPPQRCAGAGNTTQRQWRMKMAEIRRSLYFVGVGVWCALHSDERKSRWRDVREEEMRDVWESVVCLLPQLVCVFAPGLIITLRHLCVCLCVCVCVCQTLSYITIKMLSWGYCTDDSHGTLLLEPGWRFFWSTSEKVIRGEQFFSTEPGKKKKS